MKKKILLFKCFTICYDRAGKMVKTLNANGGGQSQVSGHDLAAGAYAYTLMINDKVTLSKQMLIIK